VQRITFDPRFAANFRKAACVLAFPTDAPFTFFKSWAGATGQEIKEPGVVMIPLDRDGAPTRDVYGCAAKEFANTYVPVPDAPNTYRKAAGVEAYQPGIAFACEVKLGDGTVEVQEAHGTETCWFVRNPGAEAYIINDATFRATYVPA